MRQHKWLAVLLMLLASGLIAAGCGDDDDTTTTAATDTAAEETTDEATTEETTEGTGDTASTTPEEFYDACVDAFADVGSEDQGFVEDGCAAAQTGLEQCQQTAESIPDSQTKERALAACEKVADEAVERIQATVE